MTSRRLRIAVCDNAGSALPLAHALHAAGHEIALSEENGADALLIDFDAPLSVYQNMLERHSSQGAKIILYPHGAGGPNLSYDGLWEPDPRVAANLVNGPGHAEFLRRIEYPSAVHVMGWTRSEVRPFKPRERVDHVVFAPLHTNADGSIPAKFREGNRDVFAKLLQGPWRLTVRHVGTLEQIGLRDVDGVTYVNGRGRPFDVDIDAADVVVGGDGTFPNLAVARGVPTVVYGQAEPILGLPGEEPATLRRLDRYLDYIRYPLDAEDGPLDEIIHAAARSEEPVADWKRRFVWGPLHPGRLTTIVEGIVAGEAPVHIDPTRSFTTIALATELVERPELLREYVARVTPADDASLVITAPGLDANGLLALTETAIERAGVDANTLPDALLAPLAGSPATYAALTARGDAALSDWPLMTLPRFSSLPVGI